MNSLKTADAVKLIFTQYPEEEGCSYERMLFFLKEEYNIDSSNEELQKIYEPLFFREGIVEIESDFFEGYKNG